MCSGLGGPLQAARAFWSNVEYSEKLGRRGPDTTHIDYRRGAQRSYFIPVPARQAFEFIHNPAADHGGAQAAKTRVQVYFGDARQFEELAKAIGRHLNSIVMQPERYLRGVPGAWRARPPATLICRTNGPGATHEPLHTTNPVRRRAISDCSFT